jgi:hypothetical protein
MAERSRVRTRHGVIAAEVGVQGLASTTRHLAWEHKMRSRRIIWCCLAGAVIFVAGYLTAVVSFRRKVWVDYRSGARKTTCTVFPYSLSDEESMDAFWVLFGRLDADDPDASWHLVAEERFVYPERLFERRYTHYGGEQLVRAENHLVGSILWDEHDAQYRAHLSREFYTALRDHGVNGAAEYAEGLYYGEINKHGESEEAKKRKKE